MKLWLKLYGWIVGKTIDDLKNCIDRSYFLPRGRLGQDRILVRDGRHHERDQNPITGCLDLFQLAGDFILDGSDHCKDGDTVVLGWKGPCTVRLVTDFMLEEGYNVTVNHSYTLCQLKRWIKRVTGESVTKENIPRVLYDGDEDKSLLFFGYYRFWNGMQAHGRAIDIHRSPDNTPVSIYPVTSWVKQDSQGKEYLVHIPDIISIGPPKSYKKDIENGKRKKIQSKENIEENKKKKKNNNNNNKSKENVENPKKKMKNNKGMEVDKEEATCSNVVGKESQPFNKKMGNIKKKQDGHYVKWPLFFFINQINC